MIFEVTIPDNVRFGVAEIQDVVDEASYAAAQWGTDFDDQNTLNDWVTYITMYASDAAAIAIKDDPDEVSAKLIKAANLALLAAARVRAETIAPRHYDTELGR